MAYFSGFQTIRYDAAGDGNTQEVVDLTNRVAFKSGVKNNAATMRKYELEGAPRPDLLADSFYGDSGRHWIFMLINDVIDPYYDWIIDSHTFERVQTSLYPGSTFFVELTHDLDNSSSSSKSSSSSSTEISSTSSESSSSTEISSTSDSSSSSTAISTTSSTSSASSASTVASTTSSSSSTSLSSTSTEVSVTSASSASSGSSEESSASKSSSSTEEEESRSSSSSSSSSTLVSTSESSSSSSSSQDVLANFAKGETVTFAAGGSGIVYDWDATYRRLVVKEIVDVTDIDTLNDVVIIGVSSGGIATIRKVVSDSRLALHHFEGTINDDDGNVLFENVVLNPADHIEGYISKASTANVITNYVYEDNKNEERRNIVVLNSQYLEVVNRDLIALLRR